MGQNSKKCSKTSTIHSYDFEVWMTSTLHLIYFSKIHFLSPPHSTYSCPNLWFIEWSVEVLFFWKENDKTLAKLTPNELCCFPQKELIPFSGENTSLKENLYEILPNFGLFNTFWGRVWRCWNLYLIKLFFDNFLSYVKGLWTNLSLSSYLWLGTFICKTFVCIYSSCMWFDILLHNFHFSWTGLIAIDERYFY